MSVRCPFCEEGTVLEAGPCWWAYRACRVCTGLGKVRMVVASVDDDWIEDDEPTEVWR
jgi:hypothetical protein